MSSVDPSLGGLSGEDYVRTLPKDGRRSTQGIPEVSRIFLAPVSVMHRGRCSYSLKAKLRGKKGIFFALKRKKYISEISAP